MINVYLRNPRRKVSPLRLTINHNKERIFIYPDISIPTQMWDKKKQRIKIHQLNDSYLPLNALLDKVEKTTSGIIFERRAKLSYLSNEELKTFILDQFSIKPPSDHDTFTNFMSGWYDKRAKSGKFSLMTLKKDRGHISAIKKAIVKKYTHIEWSHVNEDLFYYLEKKLIEQGLSNNYIGVVVITLKKIIKNAGNKGLINNIEFLKDIHPLRSPVDSIYLSLNDLDKISNLDLSLHPGMDRVRDNFIVASYTGVAYGDLEQIPKSIKTIETKADGVSTYTEMIVLRRNKSRTEQAIPLHPNAKVIIEKYNGKLPRVISNQKMNEYLKNIAAAAGIDDEVIEKKYSGRSIRETKKPKYELVSTHTARRSFATNAVLSGIPSNVIMMITGHKTEDSFRKYVRMDGQVSAASVATHQFFR